MAKVRPNGGVDTGACLVSLGNASHRSRAEPFLLGGAARNGPRGVRTTLKGGAPPAEQLDALRKLIVKWFPSGRFKAVPGGFYTATGDQVSDPVATGAAAGGGELLL